MFWLKLQDGYSVCVYTHTYIDIDRLIDRWIGTERERK